MPKLFLNIILSKFFFLQSRFKNYFFGDKTLKKIMVSSIFKFEDRFPLLIFGHYKCPKMKSRKKSLKKKRYKTING
jgi:hypothetical protein